MSTTFYLQVKLFGSTNSSNSVVNHSTFQTNLTKQSCKDSVCICTYSPSHIYIVLWKLIPPRESTQATLSKDGRTVTAQSYSVAISSSVSFKTGKHFWKVSINNLAK